MAKRILLGILTPSSNTSLEPLTSAIVSQLPGVSAHFSRFPVTEISLQKHALGQFDDSKILAAAQLLADAKVDSIGWSGTSAGWLGFAADERMCRRITEVTGIPATSSVLAMNEILVKTSTRTFGLATPYVAEVQDRIIANYDAAGIRVVAEKHLDISVNFDFSTVSEDAIRNMIREIAKERPEAIATYCTNLRAAHLVQELEAETGIPIYDTVATVLWKQLRMAGVDVRQLKGWGRLFQEVQ